MKSVSIALVIMYLVQCTHWALPGAQPRAIWILQKDLWRATGNMPRDLHFKDFLSFYKIMDLYAKFPLTMQELTTCCWISLNAQRKCKCDLFFVFFLPVCGCQPESLYNFKGCRWPLNYNYLAGNQLWHFAFVPYISSWSSELQCCIASYVAFFPQKPVSSMALALFISKVFPF